MSALSSRRWIAGILALTLLACGDGSGGLPGALDAAFDGAPDAPPGDAPPGDAPPGDTLPGDALPDAWPDAGPLIEIEAAMALVDPLVGTGGIGFGYAALTPAAQVPLGMVRLGPDTTNNGGHVAFHHFSGYHNDDPDLRGFSHTHFVGTGAPDYGNLRVLPVPAIEGPPPEQRFVPFDKSSEVAAPGRYQVRVIEPPVAVSLTASLRGGVHRYEFAPGAAAHLLFDAAASVTDEGASEVSIDLGSVSDTGTIEGQLTYRGPLTGRTRPFTLFFSGALSPAPEVVTPLGETAVVLSFAPGSTVELRLAISYIDLEQARRNRAEALDGQRFEQVAEAARAAWRQKLGRVRIAGGTPSQRAVFYTALYHAYMMPTRFDEVGGRYRGLDGQVHRAEGFAYYTDLSLWDTFRTLHPWYELTDPDTERDCLRSLLADLDDGGFVPRWPAALSYGGSMIGTSADFLFAGGALKGIEGVDYQRAFEAQQATATGPVPDGAPFSGRRAVADYVALGYVPSDRHDGSVSKTLEYAYSDWALANLADHLGRPADAERLRAQSHGWLEHLNPLTGFLEPKLAGGALEAVRPSAIFMGEGPYVEGDAWHWRFYVLQAPGELAEALGGPAALGEALDVFFNRSGLGEGLLNNARPDIYYWHGNEPDLHVAYLFHAAGRPDAVSDWVRAIQGQLYRATPDGLPGNDDGGTLSAWYLFSALGLYPVAGSDEYLLGAPLFPYVELDLAPGRTLTIRAPGAGDAVRYVRGVWLDGAPVSGHRLRHADLQAASTLEFKMSAGR